MTTTWQQTHFLISADQAEQLCERLETFSPLSITLTGNEQQALFQLNPSDMPLWSQTKVTALWPAHFNTTPVIELITSEFANSVQIEQHTVADQDWVTLTEQSFTAKRFGPQLWVIPAWQTPQIPPESKPNSVVIEPGLAFGTGNHATTQLCLTTLANHPPIAATVIDYGCGSGVLSLAALALGAIKVIAIDHDPQALEATKNNAALNGYASPTNLAIMLPDQLEPKQQADLVVANILAGPLVDLAEQLLALLKPGGRLLLSGILTNQVARINQAYAVCEAIDSIEQDGWVCWSGYKRG